MLRYFGGILLGFLIAAGIWTALVLDSLGIPGSHGDRVLSTWYRVKVDAARAIKRPKIVLLGGSNVLYGLRASEIERRLGIPCVNFGTHAGLPCAYLFERARMILRRGDILVLSMEWGYLSAPLDMVTPVFSGRVLSGDAPYFWRMNPAAQALMVFSAPPGRLLLPFAVGRSESAAIQDAYRDALLAHDLDAQGDLIANRPDQRAKPVLEELAGGHSGWWETRGASEDAPYWQAVREMVVWTRKRGIRMFYAAPALLRRAAEGAPEAQRYFSDAERHYEALGVDVLTRQADNFYPPELMFDSLYHLNAEGAARRTEALIQALEPAAKAHFLKN